MVEGYLGFYLYGQLPNSTITYMYVTCVLSPMMRYLSIILGVFEVRVWYTADKASRWGRAGKPGSLWLPWDADDVSGWMLGAGGFCLHINMSGFGVGEWMFFIIFGTITIGDDVVIG